MRMQHCYVQLKHYYELDIIVDAICCCLQDGKSALMIASNEGSTPAVVRLIEAGAELDLTDEVNQDTFIASHSSVCLYGCVLAHMCMLGLHASVPICICTHSYLYNHIY